MKETCQDCIQYKKRIEELEQELAWVKFELEELKAKRYKPTGKKPPTCSGPVESISPQPKKKGGVLGHLGWFRKKPKKIDKIEEVRLKACPVCGCGDLTKCKQTEEHIQEDIILPQLEVTLFRRHHYYCPRCKRIVTSKGRNELPHSYIGPKAKALAVFLKYAVKISERDIKHIFQKMFNLNIVTSSITGFREQLKRQALPLYEKLLGSLRESDFIHADETGWRIDGENNWLWKFSNKKICVSHIDKSRGQGVVEKILGKEYAGVLISDFLSAYNKISSKAKQRCLIHLLRDLKKVIEYWSDDMEVLRYCNELKKILEEAIELYKEYQLKEWDERYTQRRKLITQRLRDFSFPNPNKRVLQRFVKRLNRHKDELFTFLYEKGIDYNNNHAEQQIRPDVIFRKVTFGNRSDKGAENHNVLMSILQTAKLNDLDPLKTLEMLLLHTIKNPLAKALTPL